jgi:hypothetical protein
MPAVPVLVRCTAFEQRRALPGLRQRWTAQGHADDRAKPVTPARSRKGNNHGETLLRHKEAAAQRLRQAHAGRHFVARTIEILARSNWLSWLRENREVAMTTEKPLDTISDALCRTADAARCWEVNPCIDNDRRLTQLVEQAQDAIARAYPPTETTLRQLQHIAPDGLNLALIRCEDSGSPLIAISIDADHTLRWRQAAGLDAPPAVVAGRLSGYARKILSFTASQ